MKNLCLLTTFFTLLFLACHPSPSRTIIAAKPAGQMVSPQKMQEIHQLVQTPFKYGVVLAGENGLMVDSPNVFRYGDQWLMMYLCMNEVGYETHLASSPDLLHWQPLGKILSFPENGWDKWQNDGGIALMDYTWGGSYAPQQFAGTYWMSYIGGALQGYETDPLAIGMAFTKDILPAQEWTRFAGNPVLTAQQTDVREFEQVTLYKSTIIWDKEASLGFPFVMFYNGKIKSGYEKIGMAVSNDMRHWQRYGQEPVISNGDSQEYGISGDPQIVKIDDVWVMFYFGAFWRPQAFDTFACSYDLVHWTKWDGENLVQPSEPWDEEYAHKPWVVQHDGVVYHFYCAVGEQGRVIALATSKDLQANIAE